MAKMDITNSQVSDYENITAFSVAQAHPDDPKDQKETYWNNPRADEYWGYFTKVPKLKNAILLKAIWTVGRGYTTDTRTQIILENISGWGKDTFTQILFNMEVQKRVFGDAYCEIIRNPDNNELLNLKPLYPGNIRHVVDRKGMIIRYEFIDKEQNNAVKFKFKPSEILHFSNNRLCSEIHGISDIEALEEVIKADQQSFGIMKQLTTYQAKPFILFKLKTDNEDTITTIASRIKTIREKGEDLFIPDDENILSYEVVQVNPSQVLQTWRDDLRNEFYRTIMLPQIVPGQGGQGTESDSKSIMVAFEQIVHYDQKDTEEMLYSQLAIKIDLVHPTLISEMLATDQQKDAGSQFNVKPSELNPTQDQKNG